MILSGPSIRERCTFTEKPMIYPFFERTKHLGVSYGLSFAGYDFRIAESITIPSGGFHLASCMEEFDMPLDVVGVVHDKSTWARKGLAAQNTVIEPGWKGFLTIELTNHGRDRIELAAGTPIIQVMFHLLDKPVDAGYDGKYQDQKAGAQKAIFEQSDK